MAIETASYISDLNSSNPPGSDPVGQADDHIRLLKSVLKTTFPNITGPVSATQLQLNTGTVPTGCILLWSGATTSVPSGWALCNGQTVAKVDGSGNVTTPDLTNKFVVCAGTSYAVGATGGAASNTPTITVTNQAVTLTSNQIPAHTHVATVTDPGHNHTISDPGHQHTYNAPQANTVLYGTVGTGGVTGVNSGTVTGPGLVQTGITINNRVTGVTVSNSSVGGDGSHIHNNTAVSSSVPTLPPYYALAYIMKL